MCLQPPKAQEPGKKTLITLTELSRGVQIGDTQHQWGAYLPGKCLTGCCFQSRWWYYILSGWRRRGSPVGASRRPGEVCWSRRGAAHTHTTYTQMVSISQLSRRHRCSLTLTLLLTASHVVVHLEACCSEPWKRPLDPFVLFCFGLLFWSLVALLPTVNQDTCCNTYFCENMLFFMWFIHKVQKLLH